MMMASTVLPPPIGSPKLFAYPPVFPPSVFLFPKHNKTAYYGDCITLQLGVRYVTSKLSACVTFRCARECQHKVRFIVQWGLWVWPLLVSGYEQFYCTVGSLGMTSFSLWV